MFTVCPTKSIGSFFLIEITSYALNDSIHAFQLFLIITYIKFIAFFYRKT